MKYSILSLFAILSFTASTIQADIGPSPYGRPPIRPTPAAPQSEATDPAPTESPILADLSPPRSVPPSTPPEQTATSPVPLVISGVAATVGVVLLGMWLASKGRSGGSLDQ